MTSVLRELEEQYQERARASQSTPALEERPAQPRKATRTYTGAALERRKAWGRAWGARNAENARHLPTERE